MKKGTILAPMTVVPRRTMEKAAGLTSPEKKLELIPPLILYIFFKISFPSFRNVADDSTLENHYGGTYSGSFHDRVNRDSTLNCIEKIEVYRGIGEIP
jgi:hypothetical protein